MGWMISKQVIFQLNKENLTALILKELMLKFYRHTPSWGQKQLKTILQLFTDLFINISTLQDLTSLFRPEVFI